MVESIFLDAESNTTLGMKPDKERHLIVVKNHTTSSC
jgi:hypothetical protein